MGGKKRADGEVTPPATMAELAERLGVSASLVSMALAGDGRVASATRERIQKAARELGYQRNATASLLAKRRHTRRAELGRLLVAALVLARAPVLRELCEERGVALEEVVMSAEDNPKRLLDGLWHRGVSGILFAPDRCPWRVQRLERLPWQRFSVVKLARVHPELTFHLVRHSAFDFATLALQRSCGVAKRRVCVLLWETESEIDNLARLGALLAYRERRRPPGVELEWRMWEGPLNRVDVGALGWLLERKPDTVLLFHDMMLHALEQGGLPEDFPARFHAIQHSRRFVWKRHALSGCDISRESYLGRALDLLLELIGRGERGLAASPMELVVEPVWVE